MINRFAYGYIGLIGFVGFDDAFGGIKTLSDHVHFKLGGFDRIALSDHITEGAVAAEL